MTYYPTLKDLQEGKVSAEEFLRSRNNYAMTPFRTRIKTVRSK